jgi:acetolactate synthase-1/2/3 large subunit
MTTEKLIQEEVSVPEAIVRVLEEAGIDMVFGMPGGNAMLIFDALYDHRSTIRTVLVRQESLAGVMAEVYGRLTGKPGVALGQGAFMLSNALLGTLEAHLGCSPMLLMADLSDHSPFSHHGPYQAGTGEFGTWDAGRSFDGVTKRTMVLHEAVQAVQSTQLAIKHAMTGECGPVALLYHSAALKSHVDPRSVPCLYPTRFYLPGTRPAASAESVESAARILSAAERPVIIAGNGVRVSKACTELQNLAELIGAPVATTASGKGVFPETHKFALGVFGTFGLPVANALVADADVILVVGSRLSPTDTANENPKLLDPQRQVFIQVDVESNNAGWTFPCEHVLIGDAARVLSQLIEAIRFEGSSPLQETLMSREERVARAHTEHGFFDGPESVSDELPMLPQRIIAEIRIPAALAAKLISPERQILAVCGDGGFAMAMNGLMTARDEGIAIVVVVLNNRALGWVKNAQRNRVIASELTDNNYAEIARAMGCHGTRIEKPDHLNKALTEALAANEPAVLDVVTSLKTTYEDVMSPLAIYPESP